MKQQLHIILSVSIFFHFNHRSFAQHSETPEKQAVYNGCNNQIADTASFLHAFKQGQFQGHFRYYFMHTNNMNRLTDYVANAIGGGLKYESAIYHHFQFGLSGFYVFNIGSSDLSHVDSISGQRNRYEIGLFDMENPENHKDIDRLEELYLNYHWRKGWISAGRQLINTPFINLQDGRMRPTGVEGITLVHKFNSQHMIKSGLLYAISPRGTTKWFGIGESIGINSQGISTTGEKGNYAEELNSDWVIFIEYQGNINKQLKLLVHHLTVDRLSTSNMLQIDYQFFSFKKNNFKMAGQFIRQDALTSSSSYDSHRYTEHGAHSMSFGFQLAHENKNWSNSINYNRITKNGRYLMPREWGKDPFFTFIQRERNEGLGDVNAMAIKTTYTTNSKSWQLRWAAGYYELPDVKDFRLNKYGLPSYFHSNLEAKYFFGKKLEGLQVHLLLMAKFGTGATYNNWGYVHNKVNLGMINCIVNYHF